MDYLPWLIAGANFLGMTGAALYRAIFQDHTSRENRHVVPVALGCLITSSGLLARPILADDTLGWLIAIGMSFVTLPTLFDIRHIAGTDSDDVRSGGRVHGQREQPAALFVDRSPQILSLRRQVDTESTQEGGTHHAAEREHATA